MIAVMPGVFLRYNPTSATTVPIVLDVSRSGREYPAEFRSEAKFTDIHGSASMYVEEIWGTAPALGATMLYATFPNAFIDVNRHRNDLDPTLIEGAWPVPLQASPFTERGLGLLKKFTPRGEPLLERKLTVAEVEERLCRYYDPYHAELNAILMQTRARFGKVWHLSCHCMAPVGGANHPDSGKPRPDICLGNMSGTSTSAEFLEIARKAFEGQGYVGAKPKLS